MPLTIRPAERADAVLIHALVSELAAYEKMPDAVTAAPEDFAAALFAPSPRIFCEIAEIDGQPAGFALWYYSFSTWTGRHGLYLEDLYVRPAFRGQRIGKALLATLARRCVEENLTRFEWEVLDWNEPAIDFYAAQDAELMRGWIPVRLAGDALIRLAAEAP